VIILVCIHACVVSESEKTSTHTPTQTHAHAHAHAHAHTHAHAHAHPPTSAHNLRRLESENIRLLLGLFKYSIIHCFHVFSDREDVSEI
jgi:ABC-type nickel/cobalt efflux system permease component RcnA